MVRVATRRNGPCHVYYYVVGDRAGEGSAEHSVAIRELGHAVTNLVDHPGIVGSEPGGQLKPNRVAVSASEVMNQSIGFSPAAVTRTRICPGPACGAGTSLCAGTRCRA